MEPARPMRTHLDLLLDVTGARRSGDQIDGACHRRGGENAVDARTQPIPRILERADDTRRGQHDDIVRAELSRRTGDERGSLVDQLAGILADGPAGAPHGMGRHNTVEPSRVAEHRRSVEQLVSDVGVSDVVNRTDDELAESLSRLTSYESAVSRNRRRVQEVMDACTAELARRYQSGEATVDDLLAGR